MTNEYPAELVPILEAIADRAARLCKSQEARIFVAEGDLLCYVAGFGDIPLPEPVRPLTRGLVAGRAVLDRAVVHVEDMAAAAEEDFPAGREIQRRTCHRTALGVPLVRDGKAMGAILMRRSEVRPFDANDIELTRVFADQAAAAIENLRLSTELKARNAELTEALEQQTATAEILKVISGSPTDIQPVFDAVARSAALLCSAEDCVIRLLEGGIHTAVAHYGVTDPGRSRPLSQTGGASRAMIERRTIHAHDVQTEYPESQAMLLGVRTMLAVPLLRETEAIGAIVLRRMTIAPFTERQIKLLETFADQAVIAIENARLFNETKEALERQTATTEILKVISSSPTDIQPVFDVIARSAARLCGASDVVIRRADGDVTRVVAHVGAVPVAGDGVRPLTRFTLVGHAMLEARTMQVLDVGDPEVRAEYPDSLWGRPGGIQVRTVLVVPLMREEAAIGAIVLRRGEAKFFSEKQIQLLETFAAQAVIAIENARLFNDTREALEQQTATADILKVISGSPTDIQPVMDAVAQSAARLCDTHDVVIRRVEGDTIRLVAHVGDARLDPVIPVRPSTARTVVARSIRECRTIHVRDITDRQSRDEYPDSAVLSDGRVWYRTLLAVPLVRDNLAIGAMVLRRKEVRPFSEKQIKLLEIFADQAVIAIENARLFNETKEALEQQTATAEVLKVISSSPTDTRPVFEAIVNSGVDLFGGMDLTMRLVQGDHSVQVAGTQGIRDFLDQFPVPLADESVPGSRAIARREVVQIPDAFAPEWDATTVRQRAERRGFRAVLAVPMLREGSAIGSINALRASPGAFSDKEVALLQTFASQAVIAIENVRLFSELQERNRELTRLLEQQTATSDILGVISRSPTDVTPVFETILKNAVNLCGSPMAAIFRFDGGLVHLEGTYNWPPEALALLSAAFPSPPNPALISGRVLLSKSPVREADVLSDPGYDHALAVKGTWRRMLGVPLLRDGEPIGVINLGWPEPGETPEYQVELLKTFASQAVIAIENVRLFKELQVRNTEVTEALEQQTATAEILRVISSSPTDTQPVFDAIVTSGLRLFRGLRVGLRLVKGDHTEMVACTMPDSGLDISLDNRESLSTQAILRREVLQFPDVLAAGGIMTGQRAREQGFRAIMFAPLLKEGAAIGTISVARSVPGSFTDKEVALLQTFADQAVIAIENVRLFKELQARNTEVTEALEQQTATAEVLKVISSSPTDIQPVFDAMLEKATRLCDAHMGVLVLYDGEKFERVAQRGANAAFTEWINNNRGPLIPAPMSAVGRMIAEGKPIHIADLRESPGYRDRIAFTVKIVEVGGGRTLLAVPMLKEERVVGGITIYRPEVRPFTQRQIDLLTTFASQAVIAIENVRLFREIQDKSRQLEIANKHKSEFLANMSHELRTPLNSVIGFSDLLLERLYGEVNEKQENYVRNIQVSGKHLLSLINDILDLSKIEAGRMELDVAAVHVPSALQNAMMLMRERAQRQGIALSCTVDPQVDEVPADERKFKQIMLNLLSNAVKYTPQGGRVDVDARLANGHLEVAVRDTGVGIAPESQQAVFEEFRQVGRTGTGAQEGTGLGLALARRFAELHGGTIRLESQPGTGSTFTLSIPVQR